MGAPKRKRQSTDSAIADMSSEDSFSKERDAQTSVYSDTTTTQQEDGTSSNQTKRRRSSCITATLESDARNFGTAASQRPRRGATSQTSPSITTPQILTQECRGSKRAVAGQPNRTSVVETSRNPQNETSPQLPAHEVKGSAVERQKTPGRDQAVTQLPTPQTLEKASTRIAPQASLRRSTRERRPTERSQQTSIETTPCRKISKASSVRVTGSQSERLPATRERKSCIVRLRISSTSVPQEISQSMSFTESFSHRQKCGDKQGLQVSQRQDQSFAEHDSFQGHDPEPFAQPQSDPILADSQELYSSQLEPDDENTTSYTAAHLQEHVQTSDSLTQGRFGTSSWVPTKEQQKPSAVLSSGTFPQQQNDSPIHVLTAQNIAAVDNDSWQTQATLPWCPQWSAPSSGDTQAPARVSYHTSQATTIEEDPMQLPPLNPTTLSRHELLEIADQLFAHRTFGPPKPEPVGQPSVWADARMDLCETLHYFRSYQGACHFTGGFARGFMFDKVAHPRDYIDSNVVIARAGGGQVKDKDSGEMKASGDQVEGTTSQNLRNCMSHYNPVVIITGIDNPHMPSQPPHQYCVLDYFKPTDIWSEKSGKSKIVRYRFEKLNAGKDSWWRPKDIEDPLELGSLLPPFSKSCGTCARKSLQIYLNGWMCLQPTCGSFWLIFPLGPDSPQGPEPFEPDEASLIYDPRFLKARTPWPNDDQSYPLTSNDAMLSSHAVPGENTSEAFVRGVVCPLCRRCNSRLSWTGWECPCGWKKTPPHTLVPALSIRDPLWPLSDAYTPSRDTHSPLVSVHVSFAHNYRINRYTLPGISGFVTHMIANRTVVEEPDGPDTMFEELQRQDIGLRRRQLENSQLKGGMYTRNFLVNYGMPYKFIAATDSHPFPASPHPITASRSRLNWAARYLLANSPRSVSPATPPSTDAPSPHPSAALQDFEDHAFNEVLALGYFESQRISYHDDGEHGLGPTIATLSLGAPGTMRIRLKAKHHHGVSGSGVYTDAVPQPGSVAYASRLALVDELRRLKGAPYRKKLKELPNELGLRAAGNAKDALVMKVAHGDVVVMHGAELQRYYEHAVDHGGKLRFALTCRYVDVGSLGKEAPGYTVKADEGRYDGAGRSAGAETMHHTLP